MLEVRVNDNMLEVRGYDDNMLEVWGNNALLTLEVWGNDGMLLYSEGGDEADLPTLTTLSTTLFFMVTRDLPCVRMSRRHGR